MSVGEFLTATIGVEQHASWKEAGEESRAAWKGCIDPSGGLAPP